jgi:ribonuclease J
MEEDLSQFVNRADTRTLADDDKLETELKAVARRAAKSEIGKKPEVMVIVSRLG